MNLTHFSTFTGVAGFDLAAEEAGFRTIGQVEKNPYRQRVLRKYWPDVPLWEDIRDVTEESLQEKGVLSNDNSVRCELRGFEGKGIQREIQARNEASSGSSKTGIRFARVSPITLITGGFPCQGFSVAGKRKGKADDRYLWPEMFRVIKLLRPHWVLAENVTGIIRMALDDVLSDLESEGYSTQAFNIPACAVNAPHRRERIWIVAHYESSRLRPQLNKLTDKLLSENRSPQKPESSSGYAPNSSHNRLQGTIHPEDSIKKGKGIIQGCAITRKDCSDGGQQWEFEPDVGRVAHGIPNRVDRLAALGDAIVPQVAYQILKAIAEIEWSFE